MGQLGHACGTGDAACDLWAAGMPGGAGPRPPAASRAVPVTLPWTPDSSSFSENIMIIKSLQTVHAKKTLHLGMEPETLQSFMAFQFLTN